MTHDGLKVARNGSSSPKIHEVNVLGSRFTLILAHTLTVPHTFPNSSMRFVKNPPIFRMPGGKRGRVLETVLELFFGILDVLGRFFLEMGMC